MDIEDIQRDTWVKFSYNGSSRTGIYKGFYGSNIGIVEDSTHFKCFSPGGIGDVEPVSYDVDTSVLGDESPTDGLMSRILGGAE